MEITRNGQRILLAAHEIYRIAQSFRLAEENLFLAAQEGVIKNREEHKNEYLYLGCVFMQTILHYKVEDAFNLADKDAKIKALERLQEVILSLPQKQQAAIKAVVWDWHQYPETEPERNTKEYRQTQYNYTKAVEALREKGERGLYNQLFKILSRGIYIKIAEKALEMKGPPLWTCSSHEWKTWQFFIRRERQAIKLTAEEIVNIYAEYNEHRTELSKQYDEESAIEAEVCNQKQAILNTYRKTEAFALPYPKNLLFSALYTSYENEVRHYEEMTDAERNDVITGLLWEIENMPYCLAKVIQYCYRDRMTTSEASRAIGHGTDGKMVAEYKIIAEDLLKKVSWPYRYGYEQIKNRCAIYSCRKTLRYNHEDFDSFYQMSRRYYGCIYPSKFFTLLDEWPRENVDGETEYLVRCCECNGEKWLTKRQMDNLAGSVQNCGCLPLSENHVKKLQGEQFGAIKVTGTYYVENDHCWYPWECLKCGKTGVARGIDLVQHKMLSCAECRPSLKENTRIGQYVLMNEQRNSKKGLPEIRCFDTKSNRRKWVLVEALYREYLEKGQEIPESQIPKQEMPCKPQPTGTTREKDTMRTEKTKARSKANIKPKARDKATAPTAPADQLGFMKILPEVAPGMEKRFRHVCCVICNADRWIYEDDLFKHKDIHCEKCTPPLQDTYVAGFYVMEDARTTKRKILCKLDSGESKLVRKELILRAVADEMLAKRDKESTLESTEYSEKEGDGVT